MKKVTDINITSKTLLPSPLALCAEIEKTEAADKFVAESRDAINKIIFGDDRRLLVVIGPCSIHDLKAGREYAEKLASHGKSTQERVEFLSRVFLLSEAVEIRFFHLRHYPADLDDVIFLLCAINGEASHLVSYDPHLLDLRVFYDAFTICLPLDLLSALRKTT